ncbi:lipopolysaccharide biosynthesis protein [Actinoplanes sp. NBC_00393]|uniref:lipopolysaccharide biosynthesis protein n=1 Tax=Actinoplanes sp. NBC_00393 TaxID=2975953 RepID=UPI002E1BD049
MTLSSTNVTRTARTLLRSPSLPTYTSYSAVVTLNVIGGVLVSRQLGPDGRGILAAYTQPATAVPVLLDLGLSSATVFFASQGRLTPRHSVTILLLPTFALALAGSGITALIVLANPHSASIPALVLVALLTFLTICARPLLALLKAYRSGWGFLVTSVSIPVIYISTLAFLLLTHRTISLVSVVGSSVLASLAALFVALSRVVHLHRRRPTENEPVSSRQLFTYGVKAHLGTIAPIDGLQVDLFVAVFLLSPTSAGIYAVSVSAALLIRVQGAGLSAVLFPKFAAGAVPADQRLRQSLLASGVILGIAPALTPPLQQLIVFAYGRDFQPAPSLLLTLLIAASLSVVRLILSDFLRSLSRPEYPTVIEIVTVLFFASVAMLLRDSCTDLRIATLLLMSQLAATVAAFICAARLSRTKHVELDCATSPRSLQDG